MADWLKRLIAEEVRDVVRAVLRRHGVDPSQADDAAARAAHSAAAIACEDVPSDLPPPE
jgi:hypothetical protein